MFRRDRRLKNTAAALQADMERDYVLGSGDYNAVSGDDQSPAPKASTFGASGSPRSYLATGGGGDGTACPYGGWKSSSGFCSLDGAASMQCGNYTRQASAPPVGVGGGVLRWPLPPGGGQSLTRDGGCRYAGDMEHEYELPQ